VPTLDVVFDGLADYIEQHFEPGVLAGAGLISPEPNLIFVSSLMNPTPENSL
jgi:hypothetical protein